MYEYKYDNVNTQQSAQHEVNMPRGGALVVMV